MATQLHQCLSSWNNLHTYPPAPGAPRVQCTSICSDNGFEDIGHVLNNSQDSVS